MKKKRFVKLLMGCGVLRNLANEGAKIVRNMTMVCGDEKRKGCYGLMWDSLLYWAQERKMPEIEVTATEA